MRNLPIPSLLIEVLFNPEKLKELVSKDPTDSLIEKIVQESLDYHTRQSTSASASTAAEVHIMHEFSEEFYGKELRVIVLGYIRPERDYISVDSLIQDINFDIKVAENSLARDSYVSYKNDSFFMDIKTSIKRT
ncbi:13172_t:CDS:2 [Entrophospora sp. SA101]|nr:13172_t:CDS:2 [Entrophospora sp. SA101]